MSRKDIHSILVLAVAFASASTSTVTQANPTNDNPLQPMAAHATLPGTKARVDAMYERFYEWEKACITNQATMQRGGKVAHRALAKNFSNIYLAKWYSHDLSLMGEPAGLDLERRYEMLRKEYRAFVPAVAEMRAKEVQKLSKEIPKRDKTILRCKEMAAKGELKSAEEELRKALLRYLESIFYLDDATAKKFLDPITAPHNQMRGELDRQHREKFRSDAEARIAERTAALERLAEESKRVVAELATSSTVTLAQGQTGDAADAIAYVGKLWGSASAAVSRSVGMAWAFRTGNTVTIATSFRGDLENAEKVAIEAINQILLTLASRPEAELRVVFPKALAELSIIGRRYQGLLAQKFLPTLETLQMKHASYGQVVQRYSAATAEPTRWMNRYASRQLQTMKTGLPTVEAALNDEYETDAQARAEMYGVRTRRGVVTPKAQSQQLNWLAADSKALVGTKVLDGVTTRLLGTNVAVGLQTPRHYTNTAASFPVEPAAREMKDALLVDDAHPALSYSAADAVSAAELGDFRSIGGTIKRLTPEASVTRIATIPAVAHSLVPLNRVPSIDSQISPLQQLMWRVDIEPIWVSHRLFNLQKTP